ncbi:unnamed protein product, partial [Callosobruchus maculatus]
MKCIHINIRQATFILLTFLTSRINMGMYVCIVCNYIALKQILKFEFQMTTKLFV